jgi:hypothetical protein
MKKHMLTLLILLATIQLVPAQDIFQQKLYAPELALKYRDEAGLSDEQVEKIKTLYNGVLVGYNNKKWDLDACMVKLNQVISAPNVDTKAADAQLEKCLTLETAIKKMRLSMLISVKNVLTPAQQAKLDAHKDEPIPENSITTALSENQKVVVKVRPSSEVSLKKPMYIIDDGEAKMTTSEMPPDLKQDDIEAIHVWTGESAITNYGKAGENGVIVVKVKKGKYKVKS